MPVLQVKLSAPPTPGLSHQVAALLSELTARILHKKPELIAVVVDYLAQAHWLVGGASLAEQGKVSFFLDINVTEGTNTKNEKAQYQQEVFTGLGHLLGDLHEVSYVCIRDVRAEAWGFGGLTQEFRYIQAKR